MKIIHVHPSYKMASRFITPLMEKEKSLGYNTNLITFNNYIKTKSNTNFNLGLKNIFILLEAFKFYLYLKKNKPDLIICHNSVQATLPLLIAKILQINKRIYFNHGITFLGYKGFLKFFLYFLEYLNAKFSSQTITVSLEMKKHLDKIKRNTVIINNGSACGINISNEDIKMKKKKNKKIIITFIGRLEVRKGINTLLKILNFFEHNPNVKFIFCGFSNLEFENFAQRKYKSLNCLGFIDNTDDVLKQSDILILPSHHEGIPYSILEAMCNKNIIIANDAPGIKSLIQNGKNGFLIKNNDPLKYIEKINSYLEKKINVKKIINNGIQTIKQFNRKDFLKEYEKFLKLTLK